MNLYLSPPVPDEREWSPNTRTRELGTDSRPDLAEIVLVLGTEPIDSPVRGCPFLPGYNVMAYRVPGGGLIDRLADGMIRGLSSERTAIRAAINLIETNHSRVR